jgi:glycosyltransferase involved in cell wall biosynthesis
MKIESFFERLADENQTQSIAPRSFSASTSQYPELPKVAILLCTKQGERFLPAQLESFTTQTHTNWEVWASDDASDDQTKKILLEFQKKNESDRIFLIDGPDKGFCKNFLSLACNPDISADFYAYSDQDDIWEVDKLKRAIDFLKGVLSDVPALYCSRTRLVDVKNSEIGFSPLFEKEPCFANALIQNVGCASPASIKVKFFKSSGLCSAAASASSQVSVFKYFL